MTPGTDDGIADWLSEIIRTAGIDHLIGGCFVIKHKIG